MFMFSFVIFKIYVVYNILEFIFQAQLTEVNKVLNETQERERTHEVKLQSMEARMSLSSPLADPDKMEYLRRIMFEYMMGKENDVREVIVDYSVL